jgi:hypothetical protein
MTSVKGLRGDYLMDVLEPDLRARTLVDAPPGIFFHENNDVVRFQGGVVRHPEFGVRAIAFILGSNGRRV